MALDSSENPEFPPAPRHMEASEGGGAIADESAEEQQEPSWTPDPEKLLCALLFSSHEYLTLRGLRDIMGDEWDAAKIRKLVKSANANLEAQGLPLEIVEVDGSFRARTLTQYYPWVRKLFKDSSPRRLSQASLETLAIIAYKQPITKAEIEAIRGVNVDGCMKSLMDKKLVDINARVQGLNGSYSYATTRDFMRYFGINRVPDDLPRLSEFEEIVNAQALIAQVAPDGTLTEAEQPETPAPDDPETTASEAASNGALDSAARDERDSGMVDVNVGVETGFAAEMESEPGPQDV